MDSHLDLTPAVSVYMMLTNIPSYFRYESAEDISSLSAKSNEYLRTCRNFSMHLTDGLNDNRVGSNAIDFQVSGSFCKIMCRFQRSQTVYKSDPELKTMIWGRVSGLQSFTTYNTAAQFRIKVSKGRKETLDGNSEMTVSRCMGCDES